MAKEFRRLWASSGVSAFGNALSEVALPLVALFYAHASALQLGLVVSVEQWAWLIFGLGAGVWVDRWSRVRVAVACDCARAVLVAVVAVAALAGFAHVWLLLAVGFLTGACSVFGGIAVGVLMPDVVDSSQLVKANARMNLTTTTAGLSGSTIVGPIVAILRAPAALIVDAVTFLASALLLRGISDKPRPRPAQPHFRKELIEGIKIVVSEPLFRVLTLGSAAFNFCTAAQYVVTFLLLRYLDIPKGWYGILLTAAGVGALGGSALLPKLAARFSEPRVWRWALVAGPVLGLLIPLSSSGVGIVAFVVGSIGLSAAVAITSVIGWSARQATCAPEILGRASATTRALTWGVIPLGAIAGGWLVTLFGVRPALWVIAAFFFLEPAIIRLTKVWKWDDFSAAAVAGYPTVDVDDSPRSA